MNSIKIGNFSFDVPVFPAPMCGITDVPFRAMLSKFGTPILYSEMLASRATILDYRNEYVKKTTLKEKNNKIPFTIQIAGCDPNVMSEATKVAIDCGADIVDMNFGCPVKKVVNSYAGSALMKDEKLSANIIKSVVKSATVTNKTPVTIKMRMGWDENHINAPNIVKIAESEGVQIATIHCRTRRQLYSGKADWTFVETIKKTAKIPIIVNGDINLKNIKDAINQSNADGAMIGRALYGKPWLIADCISYLSESRSNADNRNDAINKNNVSINDKKEMVYDKKKSNKKNYNITDKDCKITNRNYTINKDCNIDNAIINSDNNNNEEMIKFKTHKPKDLWNGCVKEHLERIFDFYPKNNAIGFAIKNLYFYSQGMPNSAIFRNEISKYSEKSEIFSIAENFLSENLV